MMQPSRRQRSSKLHSHNLYAAILRDDLDAFQAETCTEPPHENALLKMNRIEM